MSMPMLAVPGNAASNGIFQTRKWFENRLARLTEAVDKKMCQSARFILPWYEHGE